MIGEALSGSPMLDLGVGGIFALLVLKEVLPFLTKRGRNGGSAPSWFAMSSLERTVEKLAEAIAVQTEVMRGMREEQKDTGRKLDEVVKVIKAA